MNLRNEIARRYTLRDWYVSRKTRSLIGKKNADQVISELLKKGNPALVGRLGGTEGRFIGEILKLQRYEKFGLPINLTSRMNFRFKKRAREVSLNAGFDCKDLTQAEKFVKLYLECLENTDALGSWGTAFSWVETRAFTPINSPIVIPIGATAPWVDAYFPQECPTPWSTELNGKKVLVIAGFANSIKLQHLKISKVFDEQFYPNFELSTIKAPLSAGRKSISESHWFSNLTLMEKQMEEIDFDVALISAGAYSYPLAMKAKKLGKIGIHCGGGLQLFFGIMGKRWEKDSNVLLRYNENWIRPLKSETPERASQIESACYW